MDIKIVENIKDISCDAIVISKFVGEETSCEIVNKFAPETFKGEKGQIFSINSQGQIPAKEVIAVGFGNKDCIDGNVVRENMAKVISLVNKNKLKKIAINFDFTGFEKQIIVGANIGNYDFDKYKTKKSSKVEELYFANVNEKEIEDARIIAESMEEVRNIANEPAAYATPTKLAQIAQSFDNLETKVFEKEEIEKMGMDAYLAVSKGSCQEPKFIHIKYIPQNPKKRIAIIGKGLCFDSGGLDIKPASSMLTMKDDMSGAACVLGLMNAVRKLKPDVEVHGIIAACENMPSGSSYKPGDILKAKNGKTIEVDNTDAEGRLTLADALCYACELNVDEVIDIATLTGACMVALGTAAAGIMGNDEALVQKLIETGKNVGEKYWELPMWQEYRDNLNSDVADMKNTGSRWGGASSAGMFLKEFVTDNVKWAHIDIAGVAFLDKPQKEFCKGATGTGMRTLLEYIMS